MHFGENQLSPGSIGILPLTSSHPMLLPQQLVRASSRFSSRFTLLKVSSPGFGSYALCYNSPYSDLVSLRLHHIMVQTEQKTKTRRIILQQARYYSSKGQALSVCQQIISVTISLGVSPFFSPFPHGTSSLSVSCCIQPWSVVAPDSYWSLASPAVLRYLTYFSWISSTRFSLSMIVYSKTFLYP